MGVHVNQTLERKTNNQDATESGARSQKQITSRVRQYPTAAFFALAILLSVGVGAITDTIYDATNSIPLALPFALLSTGPLVAALIVSALIGLAAVGKLS